MKRLYKMRHFLKDEVRFKKLLLLLLFSVGTLSSVLAGTINFSSTLSSNQLFKKPYPNGYSCGGTFGNFTSIRSNTSTDFAYATQSFTVSTAGNYKITVTSSTASDPMLFVYNSFSPSSPTSGFKIGDDDSGSGLLSEIGGCTSIYFATGTYTIVVTSYSSSTRSGTVYFSISGDGVSAETVKLLPTVTTNSASSISSTGATLGGNVTNDGGATVTARGIAYGTSSNPTTGVASGSGTGSFSQAVSGLNPGTTYYARAYATNSVGTAYGPQISFTTQSYTPPSVTTNNATNIAQTSATFNGNVTSTGGQSVSRGFQFSTNSSFSGATTRTLSGTQGTGAFSYNETSLSGSTRYYVRAWAQNDGGRTYGSSISFYTDHTITYTAGANGSISGTTTQVVDHGGTTDPVTAVPYAGYHFLRWSDYNTSNPRSDANVTSSFSRSASFEVNIFRFATQPSNIIAGVQNSFTVEAINNLGNRVTNSDRAINVAVRKIDGTLIETLSGTLSGGVVTIAGPTLTVTGEYYLTVTDEGGGTNGTFSPLNSSSFTVTPAAIHHFTVEGIADPHEAGETTSPIVTAYDEFDNLKYDYTGTITFSSDNVSRNESKPTVLPGNYTFLSSDQGVKTFTNGVSLKQYGSSYYVKVNDVAVTSAEGQQSDISVSSASLNYYTIIANSNVAAHPEQQNIIVGTEFSITAELYDEYANLKEDFTGDLDVTFGSTASPSPLGNTIVLPGSGVRTFTAGIATISGFTFYNAQETPTITITETLTGSAGTTPEITVWPEALNNFLVQEEPAQNKSIGGVRVTATIPFSVKVTARDQYNNIKRDYTGRINFKSSNDAIVDMPTTLQQFVVDDNGIKIFTNAITIPTIGAYWLRVGDSPDAFKTGELQNIIVAPNTQDETNSELVFTDYPEVTTYPSSPAVVAGDYISVTITPRDAGDNLLCDCQTVSVMLNGVDTHHDGAFEDGVPALVTIPVFDNHDGTYSALVRVTDMSQTNTITASVNGTTLSTSLSVEIAEPDVPSLIVSTITPAENSITTDENTLVTLQLKDQFGNNRTTNDGTMTFSTTEGGFGANNGIITNYVSTYAGNGAYTATLFASYDATTHGVGTATISAVADFTSETHTDGDFTAQPTVEITEGLPDLTTSTIVSSDDEITTDETSLITIQLKDHLGNLIQNDRGEITLYTDLGALGSSEGGLNIITSYAGSGAYVATLYGTLDLPVNGVGTANLTANFVGEGTALAVSGYLNDGAATPSNTVEQVIIYEGLPDVTTIDISVADASITADDSTVITVQLKDQFGNLVINNRGTVTLSVTPIGIVDNGVTTGSSNITAIYQSAGAYTAKFKLNAAGVGTATITGKFDDNAITDNAQVEVLHGVATQLAVETQPAHSTTEAIAGVVFSTQPQVSVQDQWGNIVTADDTTTIYAATGSVGSGNLLGTLSATVTNGVASFSGLNYQIAEDMNIAFTSGDLTGVTSDILAVVHNVPDYMEITGSATQTAGVSQTITIKVYDEYGNPAIRFDGSKPLMFAGANVSPAPPYYPTMDGTAFGTSTNLVFADGVATGSMILYKEETAYIEAGHLDAAYTDSYTGATNLTIAAGSPNGLEVEVSQADSYYLAITGDATQEAGTSQTITITAYDEFNNVATNYNGTKQIRFGGASASDAPSTNPNVDIVDFGTNTDIDFSSGVATASLSLFKVEDAVVTATDYTSGSAGITTPDNVTSGEVTYVYKLPVEVTPAAANYFAVTGNGTQTAGESQSITVTAYDSWNNKATGYQGSKDVTFSGASDSPDSPKAAVSPTVSNNGEPSVDIDFGSVTSMTFTEGVATGSMVLTKVETAEVKATEGLITTSDDYDLEVVVSHAANNYFAVTGSATQVAGVAQNITVTMYDAFNNIATSYDGDMSLTFSGASASEDGDIPVIGITNFGDATTVSFVNGIASNVAMTLFDAANPTSDALVDVNNGTQTATGLELLVNVTPNDATQLRIDTEPSSYVRAGDALAQQPVISIRDAYGNVTTADDTTLVIASINTGTDELVGTDTITATAGVANFTNLSYEVMETISINFDASVLATVTSQNITVDHNATDYYTYTAFPAYIYAGGQRGKFTVKRYDAYDNEVDNLVLGNGSDSPDPEVVYLYSDSPDVSSTFFNVASGGTALDTIRITNGNTTKDFWYYSQDEGTHRISASDNATSADGDAGINDADYDLEVKPAALDHFVVSGVGTDVGDGWTEHYYGDRQSLTVEAIDIFGNRKINYTGKITFSLTDEEANEPSDAGYNYPVDYTFSMADSGIHTFTDAILFERPSFEHPDYPTTNEWWITVMDLAQPGKYGSQIRIKVLPRPVTITAHNQTKQYYGDSYDLGSTEFTVTSGITGYENPSVYAGVEQITGVTLTSTGTATTALAGDHAIIPSNATGINEFNPDYYDITYTNGTLTVEPRPIEITVDASQSKVYSNDNTTDPTFTYAITSASPFDALVNGDQFTGALTREAGEDVGLYDVYLTGLGIVEGATNKMANYDITFVNDNQFEITKYPLALSNFVVDDKVYDAIDTAYISSFDVDLISGDDVLFDTTANFISRHVNWNGTAAVDTTVIYSIEISGGSDAGNYEFAIDGANKGTSATWLDSTMATISQYPIDVTAQPATKVYDGNTSSVVIPVVDVLLTGDAIVTAGSQTFDTKLVGTAKILTPSGTVIDDGNDGNNYSITYVDDNSGVISQRALTVTVDADQTKIYGENDPVVYTYSITAGSLADGDVFSGELSRDAGEDVDSYTINKNTLTIVDTGLVVTGITGDYSELNAVYHYIGIRDGYYCYVHDYIPEVTIIWKATSYGIRASLLTNGYKGIGSFAWINNYGADEIYTSSGADWTSNDLEFQQMVVEPVENNIESNYNVTYENLNDFTISQLEVAVTADAGQDKIYGELDPGLTFTSVPAVGTTLDNSHIINFSGSLARVAGENAGLYTINQGTLNNTNYNITYTSNDFEIQQLDVTVTADASQTKVYGEIDPVLTYTSNPAVDYVLANDSVIEFNGLLSRVSGEEVGFYTIEQGTLDNANYNITYVKDSLEITQLDVTVTADADQSKTYGDLDPVFTFTSNPVVGATLANNETIEYTGALVRVEGENVGTYAINQGTLGNSNYNITYTGNNFAINQLAVTVTADADQSKTYGEADPIFTYTSSPAVDFVLANDSVIEFTGTLDRDAGENVGTYDYTLGSLSNSNYSITLASGSFEITKRPITLVANNQTKTYGDGPEAGVGHEDYWTLGTTEFTVSSIDGDGLATGEGIDGVTFTSLGEPRLADIGTYTISIDANSESGSGGFSLSNYIVSYDTATLTVETRVLHLTNFAADNKEYDGNTTATGLGFDDDRVPGDNLSFQRDADFEDAAVGTNKVVVYNTVIISGGADMNNYVLESERDHWKTGPNRIISQAPITVTIAAEDKEYDGNTDATVTLSGNFITGDDVALTFATAQFDDAEIGDNKNVTVTGIALTGSDAGQYILASTIGSATASIVSLQREQTLNLIAGWNIISLGIQPNESMKLIDVLQPLIDAGTLLKVMDERGRIIENFGGDSWYDGIGDLMFTEGYQVKVSENTSLVVKGIPVDLPIEIDLIPGWNLVSFPSLNEQDAMDILQGLIDGGYLLKVMDEIGGSVDNLFGTWYNFIGNFKPGKGYYVKVSEACTLTISESTEKSLVKVPELLASTKYNTAFIGNGYNHMNIVLSGLYESGLKLGDEIGIFDGNRCVGAVSLDEYSYLNNMISIPVSSNDGMGKDPNGFIAGNEYSIRILHDNQEQTVEFDVLFGDEWFEVGATSIVALSNQLDITDVDRILNAYGVKLYPNPFKTMMVIETTQPTGEKIQVDIYDVQGRKVRSIDYGTSTGHDQIHWDGNNQSGTQVRPGVYYIRVNGNYSGNVLKQ